MIDFLENLLVQKYNWFFDNVSCMLVQLHEMAGNMYLYCVLRNVVSPGMITIVLTLSSAPEVGGLDDSGEDIVEVIPRKINKNYCTNHVS